MEELLSQVEALQEQKDNRHLRHLCDQSSIKVAFKESTSNLDIWMRAKTG